MEPINKMQESQTQVTIKYQCCRCGYQTQNATNIKRHLRRKVVCENILECEDAAFSELKEQYLAPKIKDLECNFCNKKFSHRQSLNLHKAKYCSKSVSVEEINARLTRLEQEKQTLIQAVTGAGAGPSVCNTNNLNHSNNNNNTYNIQINSYDRPNLSYLTPAFLTQCIKRRDKGLCELLEHIHYHPDHAENHNVKISNRKSNFIETHDGVRFQFQDKNKVLDELVREGFEILEEYYLDCEDEIQHALNYNETRLEEVRDFLKACRDQDIHVLTPLKQNVFLLIINKQYIIFQKKKTPASSACVTDGPTLKKFEAV